MPEKNNLEKKLFDYLKKREIFTGIVASHDTNEYYSLLRRLKL